MGVLLYKIQFMDNEANVNTIGRDFSLKQLTAFVIAPVVTRLLVSVFQTLDDSLFISRYCGQNALAAFSVALPWFMIVDSIGMLCSAVTVHCSIKMGQKKNHEAKSDFTTMCLITFGFGMLLFLILSFFQNQILTLLGETELLMPFASQYMNVSKYYAPLVLLSYIFTGFYVIAGKPKCSMYVNIIQTFCNIFFDWLFIVKLNTGIVGAAYANAIAFSSITIFAVIFYSGKNREISFVKPQSKMGPLVRNVARLGRTQAITSLAISFNSFVVNNIQLYISGETLVAAYTIVNNVQFMFMNSVFGLVGSTSPIISYAYGEKNPKKLTKVFKQVVIILTVLIIIISLLYFFGRGLILDLYLSSKGNDVIRNLANYGMIIAPFSFIFFGYNVLVQDFFNAVSNSKVATTLSVIENVIISNLFVIGMPLLFGEKAVWFVFLTVQIITFFFSAYALYKSRYYYGFNTKGIAKFAN